MDLEEVKPFSASKPADRYCNILYFISFYGSIEPRGWSNKTPRGRLEEIRIVIHIHIVSLITDSSELQIMLLFNAILGDVAPDHRKHRAASPSSPNLYHRYSYTLHPHGHDQQRSNQPCYDDYEHRCLQRRVRPCQP